MTEQIENKEKICGIIRPIATMSDFYTYEHWNNIKDIMERAIKKAGYTPLTVSDSKGTTTIHSSIFLNLYQNEIVVCDVSNRNANVMFELGMRIAFDKPVVIIKDDKTPFSFDTQHIKHLEYPSDLRFQLIEKFIDDLADLIEETVNASKQKDYKTFLSHYAPIKVTTLEVNEVSEKIALESIISHLNKLDEKINTLNQNHNKNGLANPIIGQHFNKIRSNITYTFDKNLKPSVMKNVVNSLALIQGINHFEVGENEIVISLNSSLEEFEKNEVKKKINNIIDKI